MPDAYLSQVNPVSTTLYNVLPTTLNAKIATMIAQVTWAVTQPTPLEVVVTIDGKSVIYLVANPLTTVGYYAAVSPYNTDATQPLVQLMISANATSVELLPFVLKGKSVRVDIRITWAANQPTPLICRVKYAVLA